MLEKDNEEILDDRVTETVRIRYQVDGYPQGIPEIRKQGRTVGNR